MEQYLLRGYVTPEDMEGNDAQRIQAALDLAKKLDINKVVLAGKYVAEEAVTLPAGMHLVLTGRLRIPAIRTERPENCSFTQEWLCLEGDGWLEGGLELFNCDHVTVDSLLIRGEVKLTYCRNVRMEAVTIPEGGIRIGKGCSNFFMQDLFIHGEDTAVILDAAMGDGIVPGIDPTIQNIVVRRSGLLTRAPAVVLRAGENAGLLNIQVDWITAEHTGVQLGVPGEDLPDGSYQNITLERIVTENPVQIHAKVLHLYTNRLGERAVPTQKDMAQILDVTTANISKTYKQALEKLK